METYSLVPCTYIQRVACHHEHDETCAICCLPLTLWNPDAEIISPECIVDGCSNPARLSIFTVRPFADEALMRTKPFLVPICGLHSQRDDAMRTKPNSVFTRPQPPDKTNCFFPSSSFFKKQK